VAQWLAQGTHNLLVAGSNPAGPTFDTFSNAQLIFAVSIYIKVSAMNIDVEAIKTGLTIFASALSSLKQIKDLLPEGSQKKEVIESLEKAEQQLKLAEVQTLHGLGYELCRNHIPPEIMLSIDDVNWKCPKCGNQKSTRSAWFGPDPFGDYRG
jgi:hypothetical protein